MLYNYAHGRMTMHPLTLNPELPEMNGCAKRRPRTPPPEAFGI